MKLLPRRVLAATACCGLLAACTIGDPAASPSSSPDATSASSDSTPAGEQVASNTKEDKGDEAKSYEPKTVTIAAAGDLLMHTPVSRAAQGMRAAVTTTTWRSWKRSRRSSTLLTWRSATSKGR